MSGQGFFDKLLNGSGGNSVLNSSTRDVSFWEAFKGHAVKVATRSGVSPKSLTGNVAGLVLQGRDGVNGVSAAIVGVVIEEPVLPDGTAETHYIPIDEIARVSLRVLKRPT